MMKKVIRLVGTRLHFANFRGESGKVHLYTREREEGVTLFTLCTRQIHSIDLYVRSEIAEERMCKPCLRNAREEYRQSITEIEVEVRQ
jgi:hypothetical protein